MESAGIHRRLAWIALVCAMAGALASCAAPQPEPYGRSLPHVDERCPADGALLAANDSDYGRRLVRQVGELAFYPQSALSLDQSGVVQVCIEMSRTGNVRKTLVKTSSGFMILDGAALYSVGRANISHWVGAVPPELGNGAASVWFTVPVTFAITGEALSVPPVYAPGEPELKCSSDKSGVDDPWANGPEARQFFIDLNKALENQVLFPPGAAIQKEEGSTGLCLRLARDGRILDARISQSAGDPLFDGMALIAAGVTAARSDSPRLPGTLPDVPDYVVAYLPITWER